MKSPKVAYEQAMARLAMKAKEAAAAEMAVNPPVAPLESFDFGAMVASYKNIFGLPAPDDDPDIKRAADALVKAIGCLQPPNADTFSGWFKLDADGAGSGDICSAPEDPLAYFNPPEPPKNAARALPGVDVVAGEWPRVQIGLRQVD